MRLAYTPEQAALQRELRAYFERLIPPEVRAEIGPNIGEHFGPKFRELVARLGADGWLGIGWPTEYGGQGRGPVEQYIFFDEARRAGAPIPVVTLNTVGPTLMDFGSEEQKRRYLPAILRGEIHFAIGYTEPGAGTDLASLQTRAVRDGDEWVINGQKVFTTGAHDADYIWLAARTDPDAPKHRGITVFIVETSAPGFKCTPIHTIDDGLTNATYFEDVRVGDDAVVGGVNEGWRLITHQLNHERIALAAPGKANDLFERTLRWARETEAPEGGRVIDVPWVRLALARVRMRLEGVKLLNWRMVWGLEAGELSPADASAVKVYATETFVDAYRMLLEVTGAAGALREGSPGAVFEGRLEHHYRAAYVLTFGGGVNEVMRDIIATTGLGLPRSRA
jgi:alkylation response protein AidB-like acyl-CoA dehydrogenase